jgi:hypothetical protein
LFLLTADEFDSFPHKAIPLNRETIFLEWLRGITPREAAFPILIFSTAFAQSAGQFYSVCVFLVALMFFSEDSFEPMCLFIRKPLVDERVMLTNDKFLATTVTPQRSHFLEIRFHSTLTLL